MIHYATYQSPLGKLTMASKDGSLVGLWIEGQKYHGKLGGQRLGKDFGQDLGQSEDGFDDCKELLKKVSDWLDRYFAGKKPTIGELPLHIDSTPFRNQVLEILLQIPYGSTTTYGEIARLVAASTGKKTSARAIGGAVGRNPISIIIPCHRVVGTNKKPIGYAGGLDKKEFLLGLEGITL